MKKISCSLISLFIIISGIFAQVKELELDDFFNRELYPQSLSSLQWASDNDEIVYVHENILYSLSAKAWKPTEILNLETLNEALEKAGQKSLARFPAIEKFDGNIIAFNANNAIIHYTIKTQQVEEVLKYKEDAENVDIHKESKQIAYTLKNNLYISIDGKEIAVTQEDNPDIVCGKEVHRVEFGITKGTFWSPNGKKLAFYRMDESNVTPYPIVSIDNVSNRIAEHKPSKYPMAGMKSHHVTLGIYNTETKKTIYVETGEPADQYLTVVTWDPTGDFIYIGILNRLQKHLKLNKYNADNGKFVKTLFEEKSEKWVEPLHSLLFLPKTKNQFVWRTKKDGWDHLYLYNNEGKLIKQLTKGNWDVTSVAGFNKDESLLFFTAAKESPVEAHAYALEMKSGTITILDKNKGTHSVTPSPSGKYAICHYSNITNPGVYNIVDAKGKLLSNLFTSHNHSEKFNFGKTTIFTIKANDGTDLYCRLITPPDFDENKKYPVFYYVYGGPHLQLVSNMWQGASGLFLQYMATKGYIVFSLDNRGTPNRGLEFEQKIHRKLGQYEVEDQMAGVNWLKKQKWVDSEKMGIQGWSYGGFLTMNIILEYPGTFKAAVAGGPVTDWKFYEIMYGERYMDTPDDNPEGYQQSNLMNKVEKLSDKLLIIHGTADATVVPQHSLAFLKACVENRKHVDFFMYPEHEHNVRGRDRIHLFELIEKYISENINR